MHIDLTPEQQHYIAGLIEGGVFARGEDVLQAGLEELRKKQVRQQQQQDIFERDIAPALRQLDAGQGRELTAESFLNGRKDA